MMSLIGRARAAAFAAALFLGVPAAAFAAPTTSTITLPGVGEVQVQTFIVLVVSVDPATREVIVKAENGNQFAYKIAPMVGPLDTLQKNDAVHVSLIPGTISNISKADSGKAGMISQDLADAAVFGQLPENFFGTTVTANVTLVDVNPATHTVMFEGADGVVRTMAAANDEVADDMAQVQPGDLCQITWIEAMSFDVQE